MRSVLAHGSTTPGTCHVIQLSQYISMICQPLATQGHEGYVQIFHTFALQHGMACSCISGMQGKTGTRQRGKRPAWCQRPRGRWHAKDTPQPCPHGDGGMFTQLLFTLSTKLTHMRTCIHAYILANYPYWPKVFPMISPRHDMYLSFAPFVSCSTLNLLPHCHRPNLCFLRSFAIFCSSH